MAGVIFGIGFLFAPERGLVAMARRRSRQRREFAWTMLAIHLLHHEGLPEAAEENSLHHLHEHLLWEPQFAVSVVQEAERAGIVQRRQDALSLTDRGRQLARQAMVA
jgi:manganese/zinc/iron transport system permease protein